MFVFVCYVFHCIVFMIFGVFWEGGPPPGQLFEVKKHKFRTLGLIGAPVAPLGIPNGLQGSPRLPKWSPKPNFLTIFGPKIIDFFGMLTHQTKQKKWRALRPVFLTLGGAFRQAEYQPFAFTPKFNKQNSERSALYFLLRL